MQELLNKNTWLKKINQVLYLTLNYLKG